MRNKVLLKVNRYSQKKSECAVAACSSLTNFYNPSVDYKQVRSHLNGQAKNGMTSPEQALLLNALGLKNITLVSADTSIFDFSWCNRSTKWKIARLEKLRTYYKRSDYYGDDDVEHVGNFIKFLEASDMGNNLIIDWDFPKWIKSHIRKGNPVAASINYTSYFKMPKERYDSWDDIKGEAVEHAIIIRGFDDEYVYVVDSQGRRTKEYSGYYRIKWEHFLVNTGVGDLILVG